ncbi:MULTISPECIES: hypothetical protein [Pseudomonas]|uniref:hypothetical protein n=1 Tax=Pseudomonas mosselii TaxID=78327 RepID=UPI001F101F7D|nr:hypothetical protein [Pseudomonas mosselii]
MAVTACVFIATSPDGFIAREDGGLAWLLSVTTSTDEHGYAGFMAGIDTLVMGCATLEKVMAFEGAGGCVVRRAGQGRAVAAPAYDQL